MHDVVARPALDQRDVQLARLSADFLVEQVAGGLAGLSPTDAVLVLAINQANIVPLTRDPNARAMYGALETPAPDQLRRPVSISAIASSLGLPFETVRRRVRSLETRGICEAAAGGVIVPETFLVSPGYLQSVVGTHNGLRRLFLDAMAAGLVDELPASRFDTAGSAPVRAAVRLASDFILRTAEQLMAASGDMISAICLLGVLQASLSSKEAPPTGIPVAGLARALSAPQETVRRHTQALVERGLCLRGRGGLLISSELLASPALAGFVRANAANSQRLFAGLAERGVIDAWRAA
ncbi:hypothetical protein [Phenylobacterium deserti]|uniref:HTH crp-type domain-containing protein n=1 Tax=Phenylobacterium deserti TaxID=1914756 RepID=A0A328APQ4_9CAUL|nr:hypothetical protein [Phenylobacterium deserti]RAK56559.1 hypothetical protein DJ018_00825 [Phenylobacterium deserti]